MEPKTQEGSAKKSHASLDAEKPNPKFEQSHLQETLAMSTQPDDGPEASKQQKAYQGTNTLSDVWISASIFLLFFLIFSIHYGLRIYLSEFVTPMGYWATITLLAFISTTISFFVFLISGALISKTRLKHVGNTILGLFFIFLLYGLYKPIYTYYAFSLNWLIEKEKSDLSNDSIKTNDKTNNDSLDTLRFKDSLKNKNNQKLPTPTVPHDYHASKKDKINTKPDITNQNTELKPPTIFLKNDGEYSGVKGELIFFNKNVNIYDFSGEVGFEAVIGTCEVIGNKLILKESNNKFQDVNLTIINKGSRIVGTLHVVGYSDNPCSIDFKLR